MILLRFPWLTLLWTLPLVGSALLPEVAQVRHARRWAMLIAAATFVLGAVLAGLRTFWGQSLVEPAVPLFAGMEYRLFVDGLSALTLPLVGLITTAVLVAGPRQDFDHPALSAILATAGTTLGCFLAADLALLTFFWVAMLVPALRMIARSTDFVARRLMLRTFGVVLVGGALPLLAAVLVLSAGERPYDLLIFAERDLAPHQRPLVFGLLTLTVMIRMAVFPFHAWLPAFFQRGRLGIALLFVCTNAGIYLLGRVGAPIMPHTSQLPLLANLALISAIYGALLALVQRDLLRMLGYLVVSQAGSNIVAFASLTEPSVAGVLLQGIAQGAALSGLTLVIWGLRARLGTTDVLKLGGLATPLPRMAVAFLLFAVGLVGFPGTLAFVADDLLIHGVLEAHPIVATLMVLATALNGITLFRAFTGVFLGPPRGSAALIQDLLPKERWVVAAVVASILGLGLFPSPAVSLREDAVKSIVLRISN